MIRTAQTSLLEAVASGAGVVFEIDHADETVETGWSVLVLGLGEEVTRAAERTELESLPLHPWAPGRARPWLRIQSHPDHGACDQPETG